MSVQMRDRDLIHQEGLKGGWRDRGPGGRGATHAGGAGASAELEAGGALDGVEQLAAQQGLVPELGQLQQVHAGAGRGQPLQVGAPVVDAEGRVQLLRDRGAASAGAQADTRAPRGSAARLGCEAPRLLPPPCSAAETPRVGPGRRAGGARQGRPDPSAGELSTRPVTRAEPSARAQPTRGREACKCCSHAHARHTGSTPPALPLIRAHTRLCAAREMLEQEPEEKQKNDRYVY